MKKSSVLMFFNVAVILGALFMTSEVNGGWWQKFKSTRFWPFHWPDTLMVTGNYAKPRLLAEMAQRDTNLPILVISQESSGDKLFYLPPSPKAMPIQKGRYMEFIDVMMRPKRIVFVGDEKYVPSDYIQKVKEKYPTIIVSGNDWIENAGQLGGIVHSSGLKKEFRKALQKLMSAEKHQRRGSGSNASDFQLESDGGSSSQGMDMPFFEQSSAGSGGSGQ